MRVIFMGTPDFAVPCLAELLASQVEIPCVVTQPDKPVGRKQILTPSPVKTLAEENGLFVYQPKKLKEDEVYSRLSAFEPDFIVVIAYGKILPKRILEIPKIACVNVHGSLLPKYRGAAPIQRAVIDGEKTTGITTMLMDEGVDTGDILLVEETPIGENETAGELFDRLASLAPSLLMKTLYGLQNGTVHSRPQPAEGATYAAMLTKEDGLLDWSQSREQIRSRVRGCNPWPCAYTIHNGKKLKIFCCESVDDIPAPKEPVGHLFAKNGRLYAVCGDGILHISDLQAEGSKRMTDSAYVNGHSL